ncbi:hypothetical protein AAHN93_05175 [Vandammella animalimorsus]|uniref:hypothetical protein n=1 Tax=Vandammella animalimorsus TaxID=2029117 RepID=UPI0031BB3C6C
MTVRLQAFGFACKPSTPQQADRHGGHTKIAKRNRLAITPGLGLPDSFLGFGAVRYTDDLSHISLNSPVGFVTEASKSNVN